MKTYRIISETKRYGGWWRVERISDNEVMTQSQSVFNCCIWISKNTGNKNVVPRSKKALYKEQKEYRDALELLRHLV